MALTLCAGSVTLRVMRVLAFLLLVAVLPTVELPQHVVHLVEHALEAEVPDHTAHHDGSEGDEHGCTALVHLCSCHHSQVTMTTMVASRAVLTFDSVSIAAPSSLIGLASPEPAQR